MERIPLNQISNTITERSDVYFTVKEEIGRGASCIVYRAVCFDNTEHLLKEYYPKHMDIQRDESGRLIVPEDKKDLFDRGLQRFREGCERQKAIRLSEVRLKNYTCNVQGYYSANGTKYIDMTCFSGRTYDGVSERSIYDLMRRMRTLTQVLGNYHKAGFLHLDIKPDNIFVRPESQTVEDVMLFDFDSVTPICGSENTKSLSYTQSWAAPEQILQKPVCPATDLFAVGEIIFFKLFGRHSQRWERRSFSDYPREIQISGDVSPKIFPLLDNLFRHTICTSAEKRYSSADELIASLDELIRVSNPETPYLKSSLPAAREFFVGRDGELEKIHEKLCETGVLFLTGIGGIGKSELAKRYALKHLKDYDTVLFAPYISDARSLVTDDVGIPISSFQRGNEEALEDYYARKMYKLRELCDERTLLIVDNMDRDLERSGDPDLKSLLDLNCKILVTTRRDFSEYGYASLTVGTLLDEKDVRKIFDQYYTKPLTAEENDCVEQMIDLFDGHTMTVELLAKQMAAGRIRPKQMLEKLKEGGIGESGKEKVRSGKDGTLSAQSAYEHIRMLFDLSRLDENEKYILANLSLISHAGISAELFHDWCELSDYDTVNSLTEGGWIRHDKSADRISLHPVIADLVAGTVEYADEPYKKMAENVLAYSEEHKLGEMPNEERNELLAIYTDLLANICKHAVDTAATADFLRKFSSRIGSYINVALKETCHLKALAIRERIFGEKNSDVAMSHRYLASLYNDIGKYKQAEEHVRKALDIFAMLKGKDSTSYALALKGLGNVYKSSDKYEDAELAYQEASNVFLNAEGDESSSYYDCLEGLGNLYTLTDQYDLSEELLLKALEFRIRKEDPADIASVHRKLCILYRSMGLYAKAIEHGELSIEFTEKAYGKGAIHKSIMQSYIFLGHAHLDAGKVAEAKEYLEKALDMAIKLYGKISRRTADIYSHLGELYDDSSAKASLHVDPSFAEECDLNALLIREQLFGEEEESVAVLHRRLASLYNGIGKYRQAEEHARKALEIRAKMGKQGGISYAVTLKTLGGTYWLSGRFDEAESVLKEAAEIYAKEKGADSPQYYSCMRQLGFLYINAKNYDLAEKLLLENLDFRVRRNKIGAISYAHYDLCQLYTAWKRYPEALDHGEQALACAKEAYGNQAVNSTVLFCYNRLGTAYLEMGRYDDAKAHLEKALDMARILYVPHDRVTAALDFRLGRAYEQTNDLATATDHYQTAWEIRRELFGDDHPKTTEVAERLKALRK